MKYKVCISPEDLELVIDYLHGPGDDAIAPVHTASGICSNLVKFLNLRGRSHLCGYEILANCFEAMGLHPEYPLKAVDVRCGYGEKWEDEQGEARRKLCRDVANMLEANPDFSTPL